MAFHKKNNNPNSEPSFVVSAFIGGGIGLLISVLLILLSPIILLKTANPNSLTALMAWISLFVGGIISAFLVSKQFKQITLGISLAIGGVMAVCLVPISFFVSGEFDILGAVITLIIIFGSTFLGGFIVYKQSSNRNRSMKKALKRR